MSRAHMPALSNLPSFASRFFALLLHRPYLLHTTLPTLGRPRPAGALHPGHPLAGLGRGALRGGLRAAALLGPHGGGTPSELPGDGAGDGQGGGDTGGGGGGAAEADEGAKKSPTTHSLTPGKPYTRRRSGQISCASAAAAPHSSLPRSFVGGCGNTSQSAPHPDVVCAFFPRRRSASSKRTS